MCVKLPLGDLNPDSCPPHPINTCTCGMTITSKVCGGSFPYLNFLEYIVPLLYSLT